ncbi:Membrane protein [hydrothermal vent metagenome]|uniref:Membrane protein n=1 Tax=hydrothermal vent metagenome TaxID=652676 RepID=A0A3B0RR89_9ZZZZ
MFIGHYAPAMVAATHPKAPGLGTLFVAGQLIDYGFFTFALFGVENYRITPGITAMNPLDLYDMPYTHSLLGSGVWALAFGLLIWLVTKNRTGAVIGGLIVMSHWFLDLLVHTADLTVAGSPPKFGFGLWNYPIIEMPLEFIITFGALAFYLMKTRALSPKAKLATGAIVVLLLVFQAFDWFAPKPIEANMELPISGLISFTVAAALAWWLGKTRTLKTA